MSDNPLELQSKMLRAISAAHLQTNLLEMYSQMSPDAIGPRSPSLPTPPPPLQKCLTQTASPKRGAPRLIVSQLSRSVVRLRAVSARKQRDIVGRQKMWWEEEVVEEGGAVSSPESVFHYLRSLNISVD